ncbi:LysR family transcriptional regulator [uncultured Vibrio sp.]|uniref:LysR family transcriptional regulator n=1 Tax=uncultured Vibrio sp. TaxID=114054 RepID=UPI0025EB52DB|nr:LysR family transcriptional regulator [uncultured Vibrio sp.]
MFSYEHLIAFCTTFEEQGYSAAAKRLNKDRTTIRDQVKALEETYGVTLFEIVGKTAQPTPAAEHIYKRSNVIIRNTEKLNTALDSIFNQDVLGIDIYHDNALPLNLAVKIEHALASRYPELKINWLHRNREEAFSSIEKSNNSIALMQHRNAHESNKIMSYCSLGYGSLGIFTGKKSKLRHLVNLSAEDLKLEKQYLSENHFNSLPELYSISPQAHLVSNNDLLVEFVKHDGWAIMSTDIAMPYVRNNELFEINISELSSQFNFGLTLYFPISLEGNEAFSTIRDIAKAHFY